MLALTVVGLFAAPAVQATPTVGVAPTSTLYITDTQGWPYTASSLFILQGGTGTWTSVRLKGYDQAIAVTDTIKTLSGVSGGSGYQYTLAGSPTGVTYPLTAGTYNGFCDGASDGVNNYSVDTNTNIVWKFNGNWASPTELFQISGSSMPFGITYDKTNSSLWIDTIDTGIMSDYTLKGTLLSSFALADTSGWGYVGCALDPADNTLWVLDTNTETLEQYSKTGVLLNRVVIPPPYNNLMQTGMEFAMIPSAVPIPSALMLFGPGIAGLAFLRRKVFGA
jgi:hypothetical protein